MELPAAAAKPAGTGQHRLVPAERADRQRAVRAVRGGGGVAAASDAVAGEQLHGLLASAQRVIGWLKSWLKAG